MPESNHRCYVCGERFPDSDLEVLGDQLVCHTCAESHLTCRSCGELVSNDDSWNSNTGESYCHTCYEEAYTHCSECTYEVRRGDAYSDDEGNDYCERHAPQEEEDSPELPFSEEEIPEHPEEAEDGSTVITCNPRPMDREDNDHTGVLNYTYKPDPIYCKLDEEAHNESVSPLYLGVELEIERMNSRLPLSQAVKRINQGSKRTSGEYTLLYCKHDGSLQDGIEVVSMPFTWKWYKLNRWIYTQVFRLSKAGYRSFDTASCGMHVHMSKNCFGNVQLYKFLSLFYDQKNRDFIINISCRGTRRIDDYGCSAMERWAGVREEETRKNIAIDKMSFNTDRHTAVNMRNIETVEVRIFKGTLNKQGFERNLEFCIAAYDWTRDCPMGNSKTNKITYVDFIRYVSLQRRHFPNLFRWCKKYYPSITGE
jgi:hypothetical protein